MTLTEQINLDYMVAFKAKDQVAKNLLSTIKGEIQTKSKLTSSSDPTDALVLGILTKFEKGVKISYDISPTPETERELAILKAYLPESMSESDMETKVDELIAEGANNIGLIMQGFKGTTVDRMILSTYAKNKLNAL